MFKTVIRSSIAYAESAESAKSILDHRPDLGADYLALADELLKRDRARRARGASCGRCSPPPGRTLRCGSARPSCSPPLLPLAGCGGEGRAQAARRPSRPPRTTSPRRPTPPRAAAPARPLPDRPRARAHALRDRPGGRALHRLGRRTEFGSRRVLSVTGRRAGWLRVIAQRAPERRARAGSPRPACALASTDFSIHVDRSARRLTLRRDGDRVRAFPVAVGRPGTETPTGRFAITDKLHPDDPASPYGCCALALSGHQTKLIARLAGRRPPRDPRDAEPRRSARRLARLHARAPGTCGG